MKNMRKWTIILLLIFSGSVFAQENTKVITAQIEVPEIVEKEFKKEFPEAYEVKWEMEKENYEAEFQIEGFGAEAIFEPSGNLVKYKKEISLNSLPKAVVKAVDKMYQGEKFDDQRKLVIGGKVYYQLEIENTYMDEQLVFDKNGRLAEGVNYWK